MCAYTPRAGEPRRVDVAPGFALLVGDGGLHGWLLDHPDRHVVTAWEPATPDVPDEDFRVGFTAYFSLTTPESVEALEDGDPSVLSRLAALRDTIPLSEGAHPHRAALHHAVKGLLDFYG
ncbi:hypothetical protein CNX65_02915 [Actinosynnema pretiosum]|uniref:Uncharacterized protein n=1 Tax=Actinosynnema pretiosum TaxID=42197 RepID=A0A290Z041_9PSEU|nr:hypothetical protein CNX65_02915 [Actinosynnema pretiosum]